MWNLTSWIKSAFSAWDQVEGVLSSEPGFSASAESSKDPILKHDDSLSWTQRLLEFASDPYQHWELVNYRVDQALKFQSDFFALASNVTLSIAGEVSSGNFSAAVDLALFRGQDLVDWFQFSDFQLRLLREFSLIFAGNLVLILLAWKVYGKRISNRFLSSKGGRKVIEELRTSMSELQLPNEHDFKFK